MRYQLHLITICLTVFFGVSYAQLDGEGCTDPDACNYDPNATVDDGSCLYNDCAGECGGDAMEDECDVCCGGNTGIGCSWYSNPEAFGGAYDCDGACFGSAYVNECGCVEGSTGNDPDFCYGCTDPTAINFDPDSVIDDGSCSYADVFIYISDITESYAEISMINVVPVAGFQFNFEATEELDAQLLGAGGGMAQESGFMISSNSEGLVLGFSLTGSIIPPGEGILLYIYWTFTIINGEVTITQPTFSDAGGSELSILIGESYQIIVGCTDPSSCTYLMDANIDDGSCAYMDCTGECGGDAVVDDCGVCEGNNQYMDCEGVCFGEAYEDECGICDAIPGNDNQCVGCTDPGALNFDPTYFIDDGSCIYLPPDNLVYYNQVLGGQLEAYIDLYEETQLGVFKSITIENIEGGEAGDEIGLLDFDGQINLGPCDDVTGEILTGASVWEDDTTTISSFGAMDFCDDPESNFEQYPGWIPGNPLIMMYWNHSENQIYTIQIEPEIEFTYWSSENLTIPLITFDQQILYDLNLDYLTDVADIISTVNVIMDTATQGPFQLALVDSNHDNEIDILDIIIIVNYIMSN